MEHPIQLESEFVMTIPSYSLLCWEEEQTTAYSIRNTHSLTHLNVAPKGTSTPIRPLFSQHPIIYTVNTCLTLYRSWNHGNRVRQAMLLTNIWKTRWIQCACQAGNRERGGGEQRRGGHFFFFLLLFGKASIEWHLVSCQMLSSADRHKVNWISHWEAFLS